MNSYFKTIFDFLFEKKYFQIAYLDLKGKYNQFFIGIFWSVLQSLIFISFIGTLFSIAFKVNYKEMMPYFAVGYVFWMFFSGLLKDGFTLIIGSRGLINSLHEMFIFQFNRMVAKHLLILFFHIIPLLIFLFFLNININFIITISSFVLMFFFLLPLTLLFSFICLLFRDLIPFLSSILQLMFFISPIVWKREFLGEYMYLHDYNPFYVTIQIIRDGLINNTFKLNYYIFIFILSLICYLLSFYLYNKYRNKIVYLT